MAKFRTESIEHDVRLPATAAGLRLDRALAQALPQYSRARLQAWIAGGAVEVDGRRLRAKDKVLGGELVRLRAELAAQDATAAEPRALAIARRDRAFFVIDKPAGLVVHPGAGRPSGTLQNALLALDPRLAHLPRAGIVHRLDKDTSGLLLVARTLEAHSALTAALARHEIEREYVALVHGALTGGGRIAEPIGRDRRVRTRRAVRADGR
ncbi:MAG: pseudouridine synthase, partial [Steroidobacteraceae bacterium]|nr:pseudouridine synthase [Steroidobacteraceae bacterium]